MKTVIPSGKDIPRNWHIIDAENLVLGRVATKAANILMGKHKPSYTPFHRYGRSRDRHQRGEGPPDGAQRRTETLSPALGLSGRID